MRHLVDFPASVLGTLRADPIRTARWTLLGALAWLVLRPPFFPLIGNTVSLVAHRRERSALKRELDAFEAGNARLRARVTSLGGSDPFVVERLRRLSGLARPGEFDYAAVAEALRRANPPCPASARRPE